MIGELTLGAALLLGAAGSAHCLVMCGGIAAAFGLSADNKQAITLPLAASIGRIGAYAALGALIGLLGAGLRPWLEQPAGIWLLRALASLTLFLLGLQLAGWMRLLDRFAIIGAPLWRRLQPLSRRLLPIDNVYKAISFGAIWGLLPCGLVYGMLSLSLGFASPVQGALFMGAFGLGTLPALLGLSIIAGRSNQPGLSISLRRVIGGTLMMFAVFFLIAPWVLPHTGPWAALRPLLDCH